MSSIEITLTWAEILVAANVGCMRNVQSLRLGRTDAAAYLDGFGWGANIEGACGEMAVAKHLGVYWSGAIGDITAPDVGGYQVKTNTSRKWDDLILRPWNKPDAIYISVLSFLPKFIITGWARGTEVKLEKYFRDNVPLPGYFAPRAILHDIAELLDPFASADAA